MTDASPRSFFPSLSRYLELGIRDVEGWLSPTTATIIAHMLVRQTQDRLAGDVCEIGVHHGRLFLVLANATLPGERAVAVDIFDDQAKNLDASGAGDRAIFEQHVADYAPDADIDIIQQSSLDVAEEGFLLRRFRFLSIDGGHTAAVTANDLHLAEQTLVPGGIAALDDILSHEWTGVLTGVSAYLAGGGTLIPFALVPNKLFLAPDQQSAARCKAILRQSFPKALAKSDLEFLGSIIDSYNDHPYYAREAYADLEWTIRQNTKENAALRTRLQEAELTTQRMVKSSSWRVTSPMRAFMRAARKLLEPKT